jgi:hypothetical protein
MSQYTPVRQIRWAIRMFVLRQLLSERPPHFTVVLQPPAFRKAYQLTFLIRRGDGITIARKHKDYAVLVTQTSIYNIQSFCSATNPTTYAINALSRIAEQQKNKETELLEFYRQFRINPDLPPPLR